MRVITTTITGYEEQMLNRFRTKTVFRIFPFIFTDDGTYIQTKKWFSKIKLKQQASKHRFYFNNSKGKWLLRWKTIDVIK